VDASGRTLYLWEADSTSASTCYGPCSVAWPPLLTAGSPVAGSGVTQSLLGMSKRTDGTMQVTCHGPPLYYFAGDQQPGDAKGQHLHSFGADWYVVSPAGNEIG
jgi:predicted lipoprotein with Yx(FWY)xxD motif